MKTFRSTFVFLLILFMLTTTAFAQNGRRMSGKSKGTLIGAGAGVVAGGILGGGVKGAVIGGAAGAVGGRLLGKRADKKRAARQRPVNNQNL